MMSETLQSLNNRLIVEPYKKEALKSSVSNGFAFVAQKITLKGLRVLMDGELPGNVKVKKGSLAYIKEELLHTAPWAQKILECDALDSSFIIVNCTDIEFIRSVNE